MTINQTYRGKADLITAENPKITHLPLTDLDTEYSHSLVDGLKQLRIRCQQSADLKYSFTKGESSTKYWSIFKGTQENLNSLNFTSKILYIQSNKPSVIIEIMELY